MNKKKISLGSLFKSLFIGFSLSFMLYTSAAFANWDINPKNWPAEARSIMSFFFFLIQIVSFAFFIASLTPEEK